MGISDANDNKQELTEEQKRRIQEKFLSSMNYSLDPKPLFPEETGDEVHYPFPSPSKNERKEEWYKTKAREINNKLNLIEENKRKLSELT